MPTTFYSITLLFLLCLSASVSADEFDQQHQKWQNILSNSVKVDGPASRVRYNQLKQNPGELDSYIKALSSVNATDFEHWTRDQQLAFLINAYNALTVKLIVKHYPVASIKDIGNFFRSSWKIDFFNLLGEERNLDDIEHNMIRGQSRFSEPRIHFALVCASKGCPKLQPTAFTAENLEMLLQQGAREFLTDRSRNRYNADNKTLSLSMIFKWYGDDFRDRHGSVERFVAEYITDPALSQAIGTAQKISIEYLDYDWSLNDIDSP